VIFIPRTSRARLAPFAGAALVAVLSLGASGCYDCVYCDGSEEVQGWVLLTFITAGTEAPIESLAVTIESASRTQNIVTNGSGQTLLQDLAGSTRQATIGLPAGYAFEPPEDGQELLTFAADTSRVTFSVILPGGGG
jgi:hypothetical protein